MRVVKHPLAGAEHHRAMSFDECAEGSFGSIIAPEQEPLQKLTVRQARRCPDVEKRPDAFLNRSDDSVSHGRASPLIPSSTM